MLEASDVGHLDNFLGAMRSAKNAKSSRESTMHSYFRKVSKDKKGGDSINISESLTIGLQTAISSVACIINCRIQ